MTEHLFKLKRDGKTVGYCKWTEDWGFTYSLTSDFDKPFHHFAVAQTKGITAHPFVIKDENGKDVFVGDKATAIVWMEDLANHRIKGEIIYHNCGYCIGTSNTYYHLNDLKDIEIIEDKDND